jgi:hypothetical protein
MPSIAVMKKLNRIGMLAMGDPNWHTHIGIMTTPVREALRHGVSLFVYGENGYQNLAGTLGYDQIHGFTRDYRTRVMSRGYDWDSFLGQEGLTARDMQWAEYPSDGELAKAGLRGIFISEYFGWNQAQHLQLVRDLYGFEISPTPRERTYARDSNLNDLHDDGLHDWLKYVKFGYGRATDHACRDIRNGLMTREEGIEMVRRYDHIVPSDIKRWCEYVGWTEKRFFSEAEKWRGKVWVENDLFDPVFGNPFEGRWVKCNVWD